MVGAEVVVESAVSQHVAGCGRDRGGDGIDRLLHIVVTGVILMKRIRFASNGLCGLASTLLAWRRGA